MSKEYVVEGAELKCSLGAASSRLMVVPPHRVMLRGKSRANIGDFKPMVNILPFGTCNIAPQPKPCTPACSMWICGKTNVLVGGLPALLDSDITICAAGGGVVSINNSGQ